MSQNLRIHRIAGALLLALVLSSVANAQWVLNGIPACTSPGGQIRPGIASDGGGGAVIFWVDRRDSLRDIYVQRVTSEGMAAPGWPENGVYLATGNGELWSPRGVPDGTGGAIIVWEDERELQTSLHNIYAQRILGDGTIAPGWPPGGFPVCTAPGDQRAPRLVADGAGGAIITWYDRRYDPQGPQLPKPDIFAQRVTGDGLVAPGWQTDGIPICTEPSQQYDPTIALDGVGGAFIGWSDGRTVEATGADVFAQRILLSGEIAPGWIPDGVPICTVEGNQIRPKTIQSAPGEAIFIWKDARSLPGSGENDGYMDIYALGVLSDGTIAPGWPVDGVPLCTAPRTQQALSAAPDGLGGAVVAWEDYRSQFYGTGTASDIYAQRITGNGVIPPGWPADGAPVCAAPSFQIQPALVPDGLGGAYVAWEDPRSGLHADIYAQHILASGAIAEGSPVDGFPLMAGFNGGNDVKAVSDGAGGAILAWEDFRNPDTGRDIYAHKLGVDGPVPTLLSLVEVNASPERVVLTWFGHGAGSLDATVERRDEPASWEPLGSPARLGPDQLRFEDAGVRPGSRYAYRLRYEDFDGEVLTEENWVQVPGVEPSLSGFQPNPAIGPATIAFTLPASEPALLQLFDIRGRQVWTQEVGGLGPGTHTTQVPVRLAPGIYWLRLQQANRTLTTRGVVLP